MARHKREDGPRGDCCDLQPPGMSDSCINTTLITACGCVPARVSLAVLSFLGFLVLTSLRVNLSVAIVAMVARNNNTNNNNTIDDQHYHAECLHITHPYRLNNATREDNDGEAFPTGAQGVGEVVESAGDTVMDWDEITQGFILGAFFYGYFWTQVAGGRLAEVYGSKMAFGLCGVTSGVLTLLTPLAATTHYGAIIAIRVVMGLCQGPMWPSMHALVPCWIPPYERARFVSAVYFASSLGMMLTMAVCGVVVDALGWPAAFYLTGGLCLLWSLLWFTLIADTPSLHPRISREESEYIMASVSASGMSREQSSKSVVPWRSMATSLPLYAILFSEISTSFGLSVFSNQLPTFMKNVLGFSIKGNGLVSSLPFLCRYIGAVSWSSVSDWLVSSGRLSLVVARKIFSVIALMGPALALVAVTFSGCSTTTIISLLCLGYLFNGAITSSSMINHMDIAPNFSGTIFGVTNTVASMGMFVAPVCVGTIIQGQQTMSQWRKVFWMCIPVYVFGNIIFLIFGSASVQPWNNSGLQTVPTEEPTTTTTTTQKSEEKSYKETLEQDTSTTTAIRT